MREDINDFGPHELARAFVSTVMPPRHHNAWAQIHQDALSYRKLPSLTVTLVGMIEKLITQIAEREGIEPAVLWQQWLLDEAMEAAD